MSKRLEAIAISLALIGVIIALVAWLAPFSPIGPSPFSPTATDQISEQPTNLCPFQSETDWETIKNILNAEGEAVVNEDIGVIKQIYAPNANIRDALSGIGGNNTYTQFQGFFEERDFQRWEHFGLTLADITEKTAWVTGGLRGLSVFIESGQIEDIETDPNYNHWTFGKSENGCWIITAVTFNAEKETFP